MGPYLSLEDTHIHTHSSTKTDRSCLLQKTHKRPTQFQRCTDCPVYTALLLPGVQDPDVVESQTGARQPGETMQMLPLEASHPLPPPGSDQKVLWGEEFSAFSEARASP